MPRAIAATNVATRVSRCGKRNERAPRGARRRSKLSPRRRLIYDSFAYRRIAHLFFLLIVSKNIILLVLRVFYLLIRTLGSSKRFERSNSSYSEILRAFSRVQISIL